MRYMRICLMQKNNSFAAFHRERLVLCDAGSQRATHRAVSFRSSASTGTFSFCSSVHMSEKLLKIQKVKTGD